MNRFPMPEEEPVSPELIGEFLIEEASLSFQGPHIKFFRDPDLGGVRCKLKVSYYVPEGETEATTHKWYISCADNGFWELIDVPAAECAADDMLYGTPALRRSFELWVSENSRPNELPMRSVFEEAIARAAR